MSTSIFSSGNNFNQPQLDTTLIKVFLGQVKEGNLDLIKIDIDKYRLDLRLVKDPALDQNALFSAALIKDDENCLNVMKYFIDELNVDPKQKDKINQSPLYYTSREGKIKTSEYLISKGVPVNEPDLYAQTPIYYACRDGKLNLVKLLVEKDADLNVIDKYGQTALFYAIKEGKYDVVDFITNCPNFTKINQADKKSLTPYMFALKNNRNEIAELLCNRGANPDTKAEKKSKTKKPAKQEEEKVEEDIQKPQKYVLCRINENGEKIACSVEEMENFKKMYPEVFQKMTSQDELNKLEENAPEELKNYDSWEKTAKKILTSLWKLKDSEIFHKPVDPMELGIPDYFEIIKRPMDFSTIKKKINNYQYRNCQEFCDDMNLVFDNCLLYNGDKSAVGLYCINVRNEYNKLCDQMNLQLFLL